MKEYIWSNFFILLQLSSVSGDYQPLLNSCKTQLKEMPMFPELYSKKNLIFQGCSVPSPLNQCSNNLSKPFSRQTREGKVCCFQYIVIYLPSQDLCAVQVRTLVLQKQFCTACWKGLAQGVECQRSYEPSSQCWRVARVYLNV